MKFKQKGGFNNTKRELIQAFEVILQYVSQHNIDSKELLFKNNKRTHIFNKIYLANHPDKTKKANSNFDVLKMIEENVKKSKKKINMKVGKINEVYRISVYQYARMHIISFLNMGVTEDEILRILMGDIKIAIEFRKTTDIIHECTTKKINQVKKKMSNENQKLISIFYLLYGNLFEEINLLMSIHTSAAFETIVKTTFYLNMMRSYQKNNHKKNLKGGASSFARSSSSEEDSEETIPIPAKGEMYIFFKKKCKLGDRFYASLSFKKLKKYFPEINDLVDLKNEIRIAISGSPEPELNPTYEITHQKKKNLENYSKLDNDLSIKKTLSRCRKIHFKCLQSGNFENLNKQMSMVALRNEKLDKFESKLKDFQLTKNRENYSDYVDILKDMDDIIPRGDTKKQWRETVSAFDRALVDSTNLAVKQKWTGAWSKVEKADETLKKKLVALRKEANDSVSQLFTKVTEQILNQMLEGQQTRFEEAQKKIQQLHKTYALAVGVTGALGWFLNWYYADETSESEQAKMLSMQLIMDSMENSGINLNHCKLQNTTVKGEKNVAYNKCVSDVIKQFRKQKLETNQDLLERARVRRLQAECSRFSSYIPLYGNALKCSRRAMSQTASAVASVPSIIFGSGDSLKPGEFLNKTEMQNLNQNVTDILSGFDDAEFTKYVSGNYKPQQTTAESIYSFGKFVIISGSVIIIGKRFILPLIRQQFRDWKKVAKSQRKILAADLQLSLKKTEPVSKVMLALRERQNNMFNLMDKITKSRASSKMLTQIQQKTRSSQQLALGEQLFLQTMEELKDRRDLIIKNKDDESQIDIQKLIEYVEEKTVQYNKNVVEDAHARRYITEFLGYFIRSPEGMRVLKDFDHKIHEELEATRDHKLITPLEALASHTEKAFKGAFSMTSKGINATAKMGAAYLTGGYSILATELSGAAANQVVVPASNKERRSSMESSQVDVSQLESFKVSKNTKKRNRYDKSYVLKDVPSQRRRKQSKSKKKKRVHQSESSESSSESSESSSESSEESVKNTPPKSKKRNTTSSKKSKKKKRVPESSSESSENSVKIPESTSNKPNTASSEKSKKRSPPSPSAKNDAPASPTKINKRPAQPPALLAAIKGNTALKKTAKRDSKKGSNSKRTVKNTGKPTNLLSQIQAFTQNKLKRASDHEIEKKKNPKKKMGMLEEMALKMAKRKKKVQRESSENANSRSSSGWSD